MGGIVPIRPHGRQYAPRLEFGAKSAGEYEKKGDRRSLRAKRAAVALPGRRRVIGRAWTRCLEELGLGHVNSCDAPGKEAAEPGDALRTPAKRKLCFQRKLVRKEGVEPPRPFGHKILSLARLPVPPLPQWWLYSTSLRSAAPLGFWVAFSKQSPAARGPGDGAGLETGVRA